MIGRAGAALVAGATCVLGFAPFYFWLVPVASLAVQAWLIDQAASPRRAAVLGFCFGLGYFLTCVSWAMMLWLSLAIILLVFPMRMSWQSPGKRPVF